MDLVFLWKVFFMLFFAILMGYFLKGYIVILITGAIVAQVFFPCRAHRVIHRNCTTDIYTCHYGHWLKVAKVGLFIVVVSKLFELLFFVR